MKTIHSRLRSGSLHKCALFGAALACSVSLSGNALAQDDMDEPGGDPFDAPAAADAEPAEAPAAEVPADAETAPPAADPAAGGEAEAEAGASADLSGSLALGGKTTAEPAEPGAERNPEGGSTHPASFGVEQLQGEAFPNKPVRGLEGGSLYWIMNGLQWPYMPAREGAPKTRIGLSGYGWVDSSIRDITVGAPNAPEEFQIRHDGRFVLRVTPVHNLDDDYFVQGQFEIVGNGDQSARAGYIDTDDAWIRFGKWNLFDIQVGRMQGWEIYHYGMGLDWATFERQGATSFGGNNPPQSYGVTDMWDRTISSGSLTGHLYATEWARVEVQTRYGNSGTGNEFGVRPVGILDFDYFKLKIGGERRNDRFSIFRGTETRTEVQGLGGMAFFVLDPWIELGVGWAERVRDAYDEDGGINQAATDTTTTYGGYITGRPFGDLLIGLGYHHTYWENYNQDPMAGSQPEHSTHVQMYGAIQYVLMDSLYIKYVLSQAEADFYLRATPPIEFTNESLNHRLRVQTFF